MGLWNRCYDNDKVKRRSGNPKRGPKARTAAQTQKTANNPQGSTRGTIAEEAPTSGPRGALNQPSRDEDAQSIFNDIAGITLRNMIITVHAQTC